MIVSIFNDVIGPVMRGPSSSHCAAALRIGRMARDLMDGDFNEVLVEFDVGGSLPNTHDTQGSDMGLFGGLLGWDAADERLPGSPQALRDAGVKIAIETVDVGDPHPNTYRLTLKSEKETRTLRAISTGGGIMEVIDLDGFAVSMTGDCCETLIRADGSADKILAKLNDFKADEIIVHESGDRKLIEVKAATFVGDELLADRCVKRLNPVLPVMSRKDTQVPFRSCAEMLAYDAGKGTPLWQLAVEYEMARGNLSADEVVAKMVEIIQIVRRSIAEGIAGTEYEDRILGHQSGRFDEMMRSGSLLDGGALNRMVLYVTALMEVKSSMGVIIAAPTAGACAALPGTVVAMGETLGLDEEAMAKALLAAGLIGVFITTQWTFAAEVGGCQAECGAASGMAAAALVTLAGGSLEHAVGAASMAFQNLLGLVCDPVGNRVEVPCLGKNTIAASNALSCANMALAGFDPVIPLEEVIDSAMRIGNQMPRELRCTNLGGLSTTPTAKAIEAKLSACRSGCGGCGS
ncbi:L-serine ammonia-lyase, iron-sulfur-dependent, subunit alpha [Pontiella sp.]|uniref:L-serine ammonia-lyase, iron-sulfur-dependent, subunit alpha n=1 Tax=Pontiella sp. TaxID=2837462 RepID=UPI0035621E9F